MGRYREPTKPGSKYITPDGARRLNQELDELWKVERPRVTQAVSEADNAALELLLEATSRLEQAVERLPFA